MKVFLTTLVIFCYFSSVLSTSIFDEFRLADDECKKEQNLSAEEASQLLQSISDPTLATKMYFNCFLEKLKFLKDNTLQEDIILRKADYYSDAGHLKKFVNNCKHIQGEDQYDTAVKLGACFHNLNRK
ncbi:general odorant-binding protein 56a-like [Cochliomyia hominivorax]